MSKLVTSKSAASDNDAVNSQITEEKFSYKKNRLEIQALRCIAVLAVVFNHLFPQVFTGGFVGVDVFFVISGFLITRQLYRGFSEKTLNLRQFYARRIMRLLPASLLVILFTAGMTYLFAPITRFVSIGQQITASTFYFQNWVLSASSVDYFATDTNTSPLQHFWSLSVEEQFYIIWPLLILIGLLITKISGKTFQKRTVLIILSVAVLVSFIYSVIYTASNPDQSYFVTTTRIWELGIGGLLAVIQPKALEIEKKWLLSVISSIGFIAIIICIFIFSNATPFPGYFALIPCLSATAVIICGMPETKVSPSVLYKLKPVQLIGDISYSLYLWHWPLLIFAPFVFIDQNINLVKILAVVLSFFIAYLSRRFIENTFYKPHQRVKKRALIGTIIIMALLAIIGQGFSVFYGYKVKSYAKDYEEFKSSITDKTCFGARTVGEKGCESKRKNIIPNPIIAGDINIVNKDNDTCLNDKNKQIDIICHFGETASPRLRIALVGDSHINQYLLPFKAIAEERNYEIVTYTKSQCSFIPPTSSGLDQSCSVFIENTAKDLLAQKYDLIVTSGRTLYIEATPEDIAKYWQPIIDNGSKMIVIRNNPGPGAADIEDVPECMVQKSEAECEFSKEESIGYDKLVKAAKLLDTKWVNFSNKFCPQSDENEKVSCPAVQGGVLMYTDGSHISDIYAMSLKPFIYRKVFKDVFDEGRL